MVAEIVTSLIGALVGGSGSALSKWLGMREDKQKFEHELKLQRLQMEARQSETENELAIAQEEAFAAMREASYEHATAAGQGSQWAINLLRLVRPVLTLLLMLLVWVIWLTLAEGNAGLQQQIIDGVLFMASTALAWWFGDRAPQSKKLPWQ